MMETKGRVMENVQSTQASFSPNFIRAVAIILVVIVHATLFPYTINGAATATEQFNWWTVDIYGAIGYLGVPLFVILTGVLLLDPAKTDEPLIVFFKKRFARIGIPMIFWVATYFVWAYATRGAQLGFDNFLGGILSGSYGHLWYLYLLVGLYSVTPALRVLVRYLDRPKFTYFIAIWFIGTLLVPFMAVFLPDVGYNPVMFVFTGWTGCYVLGGYLLKNSVQPKPRTLYIWVIAGLLVAIIGDALVPVFVGEASGFFHEYLSFNMIIASAALFLALTAVPKTRFETPTMVNRLVNWLGQNTLGIYLVHIMVLEALEAGYLGLTLNMGTLSPIIEIPLLTVVTLVLTSLIVYVIGKMPYVNRIV
jgi:surface polysaccharide O-acyltransferase-like enzyme